MARVRKDVWGLGAGWSDTLEWYARGVRALQSRPVTDRTSWWFLAAMHGMHPVVWEEFGVIQPSTPLPTLAVRRRFWNQCQHQSWYFLPWHRGYLAAFEAILRDAIVAAGGPDDWALPYWNYSDTTQVNARTLPGAFSLATLPDGTDNPLRVERRFGSGTTPIEIDPSFVELTALQDDVFTGGDSEIPPGFGGPETVFHHGPESETTNGSLESLPHNVIHGAIGGVAPGGDPNAWQDLGLMSMPITAALDPIFWLHHANIDRLWSVWLRDEQEAHENPGETTWLNGPADRQFVMPKIDGSEWLVTASDVLDTTAQPLDYIYEDEAPTEIGPRAARRLSRLGAPVPVGGPPSPRLPPAPRLRRTSRRTSRRESEDAAVSAQKRSKLIGASEGAVRVAGATGAAVRLDATETQSLRSGIGRAAAPGAGPATEPARVFLKLEGIRGTSDAAIYHVYIDLPPNADPAAYADRRAGTVSLFGVSAASDPDGPTAGSGINQVLEITEIVDALHLSGDGLERLDVQFVPATPAASGANFEVGRLSVFKLGE
jgi:tyrosinase